MNLTNKEFEAIERALDLLPQGKEFKALPKKKQEIIAEADATMMNLLKKKKENNKRIAEYVAMKRKENKNYARKKEVAK